MRNTLIVLATTAAAAATMAFAPTAEARQGCGRGDHRGAYGYCRDNRRHNYRAPVLVIGNFYSGRGYWDGRRYYQHRYRYRNGWRYR